MKIKWYWVVYLILMAVTFVKWFSPGTILVFAVIALVILLAEQRNDKGITVYNVYTDDDDDFEKDEEDIVK